MIAYNVNVISVIDAKLILEDIEWYIGIMFIGLLVFWMVEGYSLVPV